MNYLKKVRPAVKEKLETKYKDVQKLNIAIVKKIASQWRSLSDAEKQKYKVN